MKEIPLKEIDGLRTQLALSTEREERLRKALADWLTCSDTPEEWMRCRDNAKTLLGGFESACGIMGKPALSSSPAPEPVTVEE